MVGNMGFCANKLCILFDTRIKLHIYWEAVYQEII